MRLLFRLLTSVVHTFRCSLRALCTGSTLLVSGVEAEAHFVGEAFFLSFLIMIKDQVMRFLVVPAFTEAGADR